MTQWFNKLTKVFKNVVIKEIDNTVQDDPKILEKEEENKKIYLNTLLKKIDTEPILKRTPEIKKEIILYSTEITPEVHSQMMDEVPYAQLNHYIKQVDQKITSNNLEKELKIKQHNETIQTLTNTIADHIKEKEKYTTLSTNTMLAVEKRVYDTQINKLEQIMENLTKNIDENKNSIQTTQEEINKKVEILQLSKQYPLITLDFLKNRKKEEIIWSSPYNNDNRLLKIDCTLPLMNYTNYFNDKKTKYVIQGDYNYYCAEISSNSLAKYFSEIIIEDISTVPIGAPWHGISDLIRNEKLELKSELACIIPLETKEQIAKAEKIFEQEIYIIYEAKAWHTDLYYNTDHNPLIIGLKNNNAYLIDIFHPISLEEKVEI